MYKILSIMLCCVSIIGKIQPCSATPPPTSTWNPVNTYQTPIHSKLYLEPPLISEYGRTCYMNALMQQLYNIDDFRKAILAFHSDYDDSETHDITAMKLLFYMFSAYCVSVAPVETKKIYESFSFYNKCESDPLEILLRHISKIFVKLKFPEIMVSDIESIGALESDGMIIVVIPEKHGEIKKEIVLKNGKVKYLKGLILTEPKYKVLPHHMYSYINIMDDDSKSYWFLTDGQTVEDIGYTMPDTQDSYLAFYWNK